jgi:hypothetical protein
MASSDSADLKLELMVTGEKSGLWGDITNENLTILQQAIAGYEAVALNATTGVTLTFSNGITSNGKNAVIDLTGTITTSVNVVIPDSIEKTYIIKNSTSGSHDVVIKTTSGTGVTFDSTNKGFKLVYSDGTDIVDVELSSVNPVIEKILDTNGNEEIIFTATGSAVNELTIANAATGNNPNISATGSDTNIGITLTPKGTGGVVIPKINDNNGNEEIIFSTTASAVNEITVKNAATTAAPEISATGSDANIDLKLTPKGDGKLNLDGIKFPNADGTTGQVLSTDGSGNLSFVTVSSYTNADALTLFNASGSAPVFACRAWVNFNGVGTVAIRESGNVTSITDNGTGIYTVNYTTAMPDANYCLALTGRRNDGPSDGLASRGGSTYANLATTSSQIRTGAPSAVQLDFLEVHVAAFR